MSIPESPPTCSPDVLEKFQSLPASPVFPENPECPESPLIPENEPLIGAPPTSSSELSQKCFSIYRRPIWNKIPVANINLKQVWTAIRGTRYVEITQRLRQHRFTDKTQYKALKESMLDYVTFAGCFTGREIILLIQLSDYMCFDFDHLVNLEAKRRKLLSDPLYRPQLLFTSPGGDGLKVVILNPFNSGDYTADYLQVSAYYFRRYGLKADSTMDVARACFLCHDPDAYLAESHLEALPQKSIGTDEASE